MSPGAGGPVERKVLFSGSAPSGTLTIGNYFGAFKQWLQFQTRYDCIFCIVDLHALTTPQDPERLRERSMDFLALFIACGLDPALSTIFVQSHNPHHAELAWILNSCTSYGELTRMTQFKDKAARAKTVTAGLLNYPVLMAADILLYSAALVPVGADQRQHVELTREIAQRFNSTYGNLLVVPEAFIPDGGARIRNLLDPARKMDKSDPNPKTSISLLDPPQEVRSKIQKAKTDSKGLFPIDDEKEGIANLVTIYSELTGDTREKIVSEYQGRGYAPLKRDLADRLISFLQPLQQRYREIRSDIAALRGFAEAGRARALARSGPLIGRIRHAVGLDAFPTTG